MTRRLAKKGVLALCFCVLVPLGACTSPAGPEQTIKSQGSPSQVVTETPERSQVESPSPEPAKIGDSIQLHGTDDGSLMTVTLVKLVDPAYGADEFSQPDSGNRFVAVQVKLKNDGSIVYDDSPGNGAKLIDRQDQQYDEDLNDVKNCRAIGSDVKIGPGHSRLGCIVFQVPKGTKLASFQFTLDSGFGPETGEWLLQK